MNGESNPILDFLGLILSPIIWVMDQLLTLYANYLGSPGLGVVALAVTMTVLCWPLQKYGRGFEERLQAKIKKIDAELAPHKAELKGEALFEETERIYKNHNYHPIQSIGLSMSFLIVLPVLISAIILLASHEVLNDRSFLFISDLSKPDGLLHPINVLPFVMTGVTVFDAFYRFKDDKKTRTRFLITAAVLFVLVYNLPAAMILYWTTNVTLSMLIAVRRSL